MAWYDPVEAAPLARAADLLENGARLRSALLGRRPDASYAEVAGFDGANETNDLLSEVRARGVLPGPRGLPASSVAVDTFRAPLSGQALAQCLFEDCCGSPPELPYRSSLAH